MKFKLLKIFIGYLSEPDGDIQMRLTEMQRRIPKSEKIWRQCLCIAAVCIYLRYYNSREAARRTLRHFLSFS